MSSELKKMLNKVASEDSKRFEAEIEEGMGRFKSLLLQIAKDRKLDVITSFEGTEQSDLNKNEHDLKVLERAQLVEGQTKQTHRNLYRQYMLTAKGAELAEKLSKET